MFSSDQSAHSNNEVAAASARPPPDIHLDIAAPTQYFSIHIRGQDGKTAFSALRFSKSSTRPGGNNYASPVRRIARALDSSV
jgi:hypothetical protein